MGAASDAAAALRPSAIGTRRHCACSSATRKPRWWSRDDDRSRPSQCEQTASGRGRSDAARVTIVSRRAACSRRVRERTGVRGTMKLSCLILHCRSGASRSAVPPFTRWNAIDKRTRLSHAGVPDLSGRGADRAQRPSEAASWWGSQLPATPPSRHRDLAKRQALQERPDQAGVPH
jgi:hypothetical protein